jgi:glycosyltransferase involved in cell wall biosynthesis
MNNPSSSIGKKSLSKIAIVHPQLMGGGGSESRALWAAEALKNDYDVYLITMGNTDIRRINEYYGTSLTHSEVTLIPLSIPAVFKKRFDALRVSTLARFCKRNSSQFDLMISTYNLMDFGKRGIQCIADFSFDDKLRRTFNPPTKGLKGIWYRSAPHRWIYLKLGELIANASKGGWKKNVTIANSDWSKSIMREVYGTKSNIIYPPVVDGFPTVSWNEKEQGFVCLGRLTPQKRIERIIEILRILRERGWDLHLHIIGNICQSEYTKKLKKLSQIHSEWVFMDGVQWGEKKHYILSRHRFGISGCTNEAFGISVAEMVKAGSIVWVPNGGGQVEIVNSPELVYGSTEDAVEKIEGILNDNEKQKSLLKHLAKESKRFSADRFMSEMKECVREILNENGRKKH